MFSTRLPRTKVGGRAAIGPRRPDRIESWSVGSGFAAVVQLAGGELVAVELGERLWVVVFINRHPFLTSTYGAVVSRARSQGRWLAESGGR
jgi:hypothetical protein